ncbi:MAG TPA: tetratricopeptide repeat protein, partial [Sphingopyxis terrae]|nr:tetratricopeptide repeat protein [Sphingopyxis terrae]
MDRAKANKTLEAGETDQIIAEEFERLRESQLFLRSPVLSRLLQYLVEHRLRGGRSAPKAYAIATEALGRNADFDPAVDSYPRVMVGRLRNLLDRYYAETPWVHRLRVPQGSYEIVVQHRTAPPARSAAVTPGVGEDAAAAE